jgi:heme exporter protein D
MIAALNIARALWGSMAFRYAALAVAVAGGIQVWGHHKVQQGVQQQVAKQEKVDDTARKIMGNAARKSGDPGARGVLDPYSVQ